MGGNRYSQIEFSKNPDKYIKFDKEAVDRMISKFFDSSS